MSAAQGGLIPSIRRAGSLCAWFLCCVVALPGHAHGGSLYDEKTYRPLAADNKAFRVGDVITVQVIESASASTDSDTTTRRTNNLSAAIAHRTGKVAGADVAISGEFDGGGSTQRTGRLLAQLTVSVREILPSGEMKVGGEQRLTLNNELQRIYLEGRIRSQDISDGNVVLSSRLADARIDYLGDGDLSERQKHSWWRKLVDWLGL